jgi:hypothetical protein
MYGIIVKLGELHLRCFLEPVMIVMGLAFSIFYYVFRHGYYALVSVSHVDNICSQTLASGEICLKIRS